MSNVDVLSEDQKSRMKVFMCQLVEAKILAGKAACTEEGIRAALPAAKETACVAVLTLDEELNASRFANYVANARDQIRVVATKLVEGKMRSGAMAGTLADIQAGVKQAVEDARRAVIAVDEFLCG